MKLPRPWFRLAPDPPLPSDRARAWMRAVRPTVIADTVSVSRSTAFAWVTRCMASGRPPRRQHLRELIAWSKQQPSGVGPIGWEDFYGDPTCADFRRDRDQPELFQGGDQWAIA